MLLTTRALALSADVDAYGVDEPDSVLRWTLADSVCSLVIIVSFMLFIHTGLLFVWSRCMNRRYYFEVWRPTHCLKRSGLSNEAPRGVSREAVTPTHAARSLPR